MDSSLVYIIIAMTAFVLIIIGLVFTRRKRQKFSWFLNAGLLLIVLSMFFESRLIAYPLMGLGVVLAIIDAVIKFKKTK